MKTMTEVLNEIFLMENRINSLYDDFLRQIVIDYRIEVIDDKIQDWANMTWDEFSSYMLNKGIDLENSSRNWKHFFDLQKENLSVLRNHNII